MNATRCSAASIERGDDLAGTGSHVRAFLLMEEPGPWGHDAFTEARLPAGFGAELARRCSAASVRPLLIRRQDKGAFRTRAGGEAVPTHRRVFAAYVDQAGGFVETTTVGDPRDLLDLDLGGLRKGRSVGLTAWHEPVFAVCTQGRHDACCAEKGRPVARALATVEPEATWQVSHVGGDRFAANLLVLGGGLYYGRLTPGSVIDVAARHRAGRLDLEHLRGRSCWPMPVQAAEIALRRALGRDELHGWRVELRHRERRADVVSSRLATPDGVWEVAVLERRSEPVRLTCSARREHPAVSWRLVAMTKATA